MLIIWKDFGHQVNKNDKTIAEFLKSVLIEVVSENYRHLMAESVQRSEEYRGNKKCDGRKEMVFNPPLRGRERIVSGIFATAVSRVAQRSYPEARVDRPISREMDPEDGGNDEGQSAGRVDYLAFYQDRTIGFELKSAVANFNRVVNGTGGLTGLAIKRWANVQAQAMSAVRFLEKNPDDYPGAVGLAVMTLAARSVRKNRGQPESGFCQTFANEIEKNLMAPGGEDDFFVAVCEMPEKFRLFKNLSGKENGGDVYTPAIAFVARKFSQ
ncbi:hypothetical protein [Acidovorax sp. MR-S7]|uniref:hypothetical protein n=1 Tax=Acidovorax sp. MR-S7 TaxID=1268622 RepID=UPI00118738E0|nr:hypothetical protein [Acidovorax sp. MR-S7]